MSDDANSHDKARRTFMKGTAAAAGLLTLGAGNAVAGPYISEQEEDDLARALTETTNFWNYVDYVGYEGQPEQAAVFTDPLQGFPIEGDQYTILSTGVAEDAPGTADELASSSLGGITEDVIVEGDQYTAYDVVRLCITFTIPDDARALAFEYKFGTEENPDYLGSVYQDNFRAILTAPGFRQNIALLPDGSLVDVDNANIFSNNPGGTSENPTPTFPSPNDVKYNAVTQQLTGAINLSAAGLQGEQAQLTFRLADASDEQLDSAALLDRLRLFRSADGGGTE